MTLYYDVRCRHLSLYHSQVAVFAMALVSHAYSLKSTPPRSFFQTHEGPDTQDDKEEREDILGGIIFRISSEDI